ncbi:putative aminotransferase class I and II family protein [Parathielavia appendiculata]|uniref:Aminotransferase class I and II family protein n=1 Tax=Parathielavia appendiculata TaxID=2587402 RepID=A0AAN6U4W1_9PEZI|nr:putative aminotransferase class I and II family protein [Parathielavia appendiculata]
MHQEVVEFTAKNVAVDPVRHLTYGSGFSPRSSLNSNFQPREPVRYEDIIVQPGVTAVIDSLACAICNEGEGIIIPHPFYMGFAVDIPTRARGVIVPAVFQSLADHRGFVDVFDAEMNIEALDKALKGTQENGIKVRAVLLTNPHNPLGRCYNPRAPAPVPFTSILALNLADRIDPQLVHLAYGASKDFCANGLRLGMLYTRNQGLLAAIAGTSMLAWPPYIIQDLWASMLENGAYTEDFFATNQQRLAEQYAFATQFLDDHGIPYYRDSYAGMFIWIDLRRYMIRGEELPSLSIYTLNSRDKEVYQQRELEISNRCVANGVAIALGTNFCTEELGWFRLTFSVSRQALEVELQRMVKALQDITQ